MEEWFSIPHVQVAVRAYRRRSGPVRRHVRGWPRQYRRSCPREWCKSGGGFALSGRAGRYGQAAATAGSLTRGSSLKGAMVSSVM